VLVLFAQGVTAADRPSDHRITQTVERELQNDFRLREAEIEVRTTAGKVTLTGKVDSVLDKRRAERLCRKIDGIQEVSNRIEIEPVPRSDEDISHAVTGRWEEDSLLHSQNLEAVVDSRVVTIKGTVSSFYQRQHAEQLAREVHGVLLVRNELKIESNVAAAVQSTPFSDEDVRGRVLESIDRDATLFQLPIDVTIEKDVVTLTGAVENLDQRDRATRRIRSLPGVRQVNNQLTVGSIVPEAFRVLKPSDDPDARVAHDVSAELQADSAVDPTKVDVTSSGGFVVLRGSIPSMYQKLRAAHIARQVASVRWVTNELTVDDDPRDDAEIQRGVERLLESDAAINDDHISVSVNKSFVSLSGTVDNIAEKRRATRIATRIRGVLSVSNDIEVEWSRQLDDKLIHEQIIARLNADSTTRRIVDRIQITVTGGNVTIKGITDLWAEQRRAIQIAESTDGVRSVQHGLTVDNLK